jgi:hypothetical protein
MTRSRERSIFTSVLLAWVAFFAYATLDLGPAARLVPLSVAVPTLGLLIFQLAVDLVPRLEQRYRKFDKVDLLRVEPLRKKVPAAVSSETSSFPDGEIAAEGEWRLFVWILFLPVLIYLLGLLIALPLHVLLYLRVRSRESWTLSIATAACLSAALYGIFVAALRIRLFEGVLRAWVGI